MLFRKETPDIYHIKYNLYKAQTEMCITEKYTTEKWTTEKWTTEKYKSEKQTSFK